LASSCSSNVSTKAVSSCGLEISLGARFLTGVGCFVAPFTLEAEALGVLLGLGEVGTFKGAGPIVGSTKVKYVDEKGQWKESRAQWGSGPTVAE